MQSKNSFALSPYKVLLCLLVYTSEQTLTTTFEQLDLLSNYVSKAVKAGLPERSFKEFNSDLL
jgi:hypothetical protein